MGSTKEQIGMIRMPSLDDTEWMECCVIYTNVQLLNAQKMHISPVIGDFGIYASYYLCRDRTHWSLHKLHDTFDNVLPCRFGRDLATG